MNYSYKMYMNIEPQLENIIQIHYSRLHKTIRELNPDESELYEDIIYYQIEKNLKSFEQRINNKVKNNNKKERIFKLANTIATFYCYNLNDNKINEIINKKTKNLNEIVGKFNAQSFYENLQAEEKKLFDKTFNYRVKINENNFTLDFVLDKNKRINIIEAYYICNKTEKLDLTEDFNGMTLKQATKLLKEFGLKEAEKIVDKKRAEVEYKTETIDEIYKYIMYLIMYKNNNLAGAKKAMIFAQDYYADINIPIRYAISSNDKHIKDIINYYYLLGGKDAICFANYYENKDKLIKHRNRIHISEIGSTSKTKKRKR